MKRLVVAALALSTIAAARWGGWAVVSVENAPDHFVIGKPTTFDFIVRQHGVEPLRELRPSIEARSGSKRVEGRAWETPKAGVYRASITIPETGDWAVTIESGFGPSKGRLVPTPAIAANAASPPRSDAARGRQLFASAGCVTCHVHDAVDMEPMLKGAAPDLSNKRFAADYLARFLADPSIKPKSPDMMEMPNLRLRQSDIAALVAFINSDRGVAKGP
jgi:cytochrome c551/c552